MKRRTLLKTAAAGAVAFGAGRIMARTPERALPQLARLDVLEAGNPEIALELAEGLHDFGNGTTSPALGINQGYLGPVLRVRKGQSVRFDVTNRLDEVTTLHWHGLHIPGEVDGGPHQEIAPGETWSPVVPIAQQASMNWYHSHAHGKTASQVYRGLAGVFLVEDDDSLAADLPQTEGVDDFTLVIQDKTFDGLGRLSYQVSGQVFEDGFMGDEIVVNGAIAPLVQPVPAGLVRLRLLNACNARTLKLSLDRGPFVVIASEGGFLSSAVETDELTMFAGERYEVLVDMGRHASNEISIDLGGREGGVFRSLLGGGANRAGLRLVASGEQGFTGSMPNLLASLPRASRGDATVTRNFELQMYGGKEMAAFAAAWGNICGDGPMRINDLPMKMDRIDEEVRLGATELWRIRADEGPHPFHIHGCSFRILSQSDDRLPRYAEGWKDIVNVRRGWSEVLVRFEHSAPAHAPYMYHCHILEHEDCGMMGQFTVT